MLLQFCDIKISDSIYKLSVVPSKFNNLPHFMHVVIVHNDDYDCNNDEGL